MLLDLLNVFLCCGTEKEMGVGGGEWNLASGEMDGTLLLNDGCCGKPGWGKAIQPQNLGTVSLAGCLENELQTYRLCKAPGYSRIGTVALHTPHGTRITAGVASPQSLHHHAHAHAHAHTHTYTYTYTYTHTIGEGCSSWVVWPIWRERERESCRMKFEMQEGGESNLLQPLSSPLSDHVTSWHLWETTCTWSGVKCQALSPPHAHSHNSTHTHTLTHTLSPRLGLYCRG